MRLLGTGNSMLRKGLDSSRAFVRGICTFGIREKIKYPTKIVEKKFKLNHSESLNGTEGNGASRIRYWCFITLIPLLILIISFSFISEPTKFFSKSGGINVSDMKKFVILPSIAIISFMIYVIYTYFKSGKIVFHRKTKVKHIKIKGK
jgi:hypothetical protein